MAHPYRHDAMLATTPVPALRVAVSDGSGRWRHGWGKIDTGADITVIPESMRDKLHPPMHSQRRNRQTGEELPTYLLKVRMDGRTYRVEAASRKSDYVLIGRDILNELRLIADGPAQEFWFE